ncbi:MAG: hypothetical protein ACOYK8_09045 [Alphaproteobacteria bacterium]
MSQHLSFFPLIAWWQLALITGLFVAIFGLLLWQRQHIKLRAFGWRVVGVLLLLLTLAQPEWRQEERQYLPDVVTILMDDSDSQRLDGRRERSVAALNALLKQKSSDSATEWRVVNIPSSTENTDSISTKIIPSALAGLANIPDDRSAGVIIISDGQVHDDASSLSRLAPYGPVHFLNSGHEHEKDWQLQLLSAPSYGLWNEFVTAKFNIIGEAGRSIPLTLTLGDGSTMKLQAVTGKEISVDIPITQQGDNEILAEIPVEEGELSADNNHQILHIQGVRDRLRVLLVTGSPNLGGRSWRNLLKADPAVDLVHFTILRSPEKVDFTPVEQMSLIAFPVKELFETRLKGFDLIVLDRYSDSGALPPTYYDNLADYVNNGGALLHVAGSEHLGNESLQHTKLGKIFPSIISGSSVQETEFTPQLSDMGKRHPITSPVFSVDNHLSSNQHSSIGHWLRLIPLQAKADSQTLLEGADHEPLLMVAHQGRGRVAQLASDQIWLWSRGYEEGGPYAPLLRRLAHWLMGDKMLDENNLNARIINSKLVVDVQTTSHDTLPITITLPDSTSNTENLPITPQGTAHGEWPAPLKGRYHLQTPMGEKILLPNNNNSREFQDVRSTTSLLSPLIQQTGGGIYSLAEKTDWPVFFARKELNPHYNPSNKLGLRQNQQYKITGEHFTRLIPLWFGLLLSLSFIVLGWWREGK